VQHKPRRIVVDSRGTWCPPIPITDLFKAWRSADLGDIIELSATEPNIEEDVKAWAKKSGNKVIDVRREKDVTHIVVRVLRKGKEVAILPAAKGNFSDPDETKITPKAKLQLLIVNGFAVGLRTLEPGWRWSADMQPLAKTASCQIRHVGYVVSGRMGFLMDDGTELSVGPGEVFDVRPGHDTWTIGDSPAVFVDIIGAVER
jgi:TusA-related sulfurtransferase